MSPDGDDDFDQYDDTILSLFIVDSEGHVVGESIGVEGSKLVLKHKGVFYVIPLNSVKKSKGNLKLIKSVDWTAARAYGERWKKENLDPLWGTKPIKPKKIEKKTPKKKRSSKKKPPKKLPPKKLKED